MVSDKYPNTLKIEVVESAANTFTAENIEWPATLARSAVIELLKLKVLFQNPELIAVTLTNVSFHLSLDTNESALQALDNQKCIIRDIRNVLPVGARTAEPTGLTMFDSLKEYSFQDNQGLGKLLPASEWQIAIKGVGNVSAKTLSFEIDYRIVSVGANELLDILETYA